MANTSKNDEQMKIPTHVGIIMDGNGRWAKSRGLPRLAGHKAGTENLRRVIRACVEFGIQYLTIYAFSTENWGRPKDEVEGLLRILAEVIEKELPELNEQGVQLHHIGRLEDLPENLRQKVNKAIEITKNNQRLVLNVAFNYGGRDEIVCAIKQMMRDGVTPEQVTPDLISSYMFTAGMPDPDLIIRTSGEMRTSNFLIWQASYAEWYVTPTFWPDFDKEELRKALVAFAQRDRRFGKLSEQDATGSKPVNAC
ncbi:UDP pyrophosphate synthase [Ornatilinea apprima]|uniref:Isoprenyl transferase n=1 Tax=Ornatilinea apprima TaxID=1134406 RepID=A0A0N8GLV8_9CHLR|nr:isoprenyl transferase [Ornatilinea apprima]KPL73578.1 UDP pyrophosphate synthase [Ornatilinea apprima]